MAAEGQKREDEIGRQQSDRFDPTHLSNAEQSAGDEYGLSSRQEEKLQNKLERADGQLKDYSPDKNIDDVREQEAALTSGLYTGSGRTEQKETVSLKTVFKKKGALGALIALGLGLPTVLTIMLSPALLLQQLAETMTGEFNDQLAALDARSTLLLKKKLNSTITKGTCGTKITFRCKYQSVREKSGFAKRLEKAGVTIKGDDSIIPGRVKPTHFVFEGKEIKAKDLLNEARKNPALRSALRKGYDPLYAAFSDKISTKVRAKLGLKRSSDIKPSTDNEKMNEDLKKVASGELDLPDTKLTPVTDEEGKVTGYEHPDEPGKTYPKADGERINGLIDEIADRSKIADSVTKAGLKSGVKSALTVTALGVGAVDSLCTAWVVLRVASFAAKVYQQKQLIRYGYEFMKIAHKQKNGDLTAEEMEFFGNKLTSTNSEGKAALDSAGFKFAAYGDTFSPGDFDTSANANSDEATLDKEAEKIALENETSRYVNGQLLKDNIMSQLVGAIAKSGSKTVEGADKVCKFTKSWKGQAIVIGAAILGAVVAFFSGGVSIGWGAIANGAAMVSVSVAFALVQPMLLDMVKGDVIKGDENGNETGNGIASGMGGYNAQTAPGGGLGVATQGTYTTYKQLNEEVIAKNAEIDRSERSPFDPTSKNTFLGSIVSSIIPYSTKMSSIGSASLATSSFITSSFASLGTKQTANAAAQSSKYSKCDDNEYKGLAADPFCNLRYAVPLEDLNIDPDKVAEYMTEKHDYAADDDATPLGDYADYVKKCFSREDSIGDPNSSEGDGKECIIGKGGENEYRNKMFRLFYIDTRVSDGYDEDFDSDSNPNNSTTNGEATSFTVSSYNMCHEVSHENCRFANKQESLAKTIKGDSGVGNPTLDIVGAQELSKDTQEAVVTKTGYETFPPKKDLPNSNGRAIFWDPSKFTKGESGWLKGVHGNGGNHQPGNDNDKFPWVQLTSTSGQSVYVLSMHNPLDKYADSQGGPFDRWDNAVKIRDWAKSKTTSNSMAIVTGDFNQGGKTDGGKPTAYCVFTDGGLMQHAMDMAKNKSTSKECPTSRIPIDQIYASTNINGLKATDWNRITGLGNKTGTDHSPAWVTYSIPGEGDGEVIDGPSKDGWVWPVPSIKTMGTLGYGKSGSKGVHKGIDIGRGLGAPVVAAHDGVVNWVDSRNSACGAYISITASGTKYYAAYQHIDGPSIKVKKGDTVKAGQVIAKIGRQGGSTCGSAGFYHLHFSIESKPGMVSAYANPFPNGTINPLSVLPRP